MWRGDPDSSNLFDELHLLREELRQYKIDLRTGIDLRAVVERADCCICVATLAGKLLYVNAFFASRHGYDPQECIGLNVSTFLRASQHEEVDRLLGLVAKGQAVSSVALAHVAKNGAEFSTTSVLFPLSDSSDTPALLVVVSIAKDEPEWHSAPAGCRVAADAAARRLFEEAPLPYVVLDVRGRIRDVNRRWRESFGFLREEACGTPLAELLEEESRRRFESEFPLMLRTETIVGSEFRLIAADGRIAALLFYCQIERDAQGNLCGVLCICRDMTEQGRSVEQLRPVEALLHDAENQGLVGYWELDLQGYRMAWSDEMYRLLRRDKAAGPSGLDNAMRYFGIVLEDLEPYVRRVLAKKERLDREFPLMLSQGDQRWFQCVINVSVDPTGKPLRLYGTLQDITLRKKLEESLREKDARMRHQNLELAWNEEALKEIFARLRAVEQTADMRIREIVQSQHPLAALTGREMEVCQMIRKGLSSKEIAAMLSISSLSVQTHRNHIRRKLGLLNKGLNLAGYLQSLEGGSGLENT